MRYFNYQESWNDLLFEMEGVYYKVFLHEETAYARNNKYPHANIKARYFHWNSLSKIIEATRHHSSTTKTKWLLRGHANLWHVSTISKGNGILVCHWLQGSTTVSLTTLVGTLSSMHVLSLVLVEISSGFYLYFISCHISIFMMWQRF